MTSLLVRGFLFAFAVYSASGLPRPAFAQKANYFPTAVGSEWIYTSGGVELTATIVKVEDFKGSRCALTQGTVSGRVVSQEHVKIETDGVYRHSYDGHACSPPLRFIKLPLKKGDRWNVDSKIGGEAISGGFVVSQEKVKVPAGEFDTFLVASVDQTANGKPLVNKMWYAANVGMVKQILSVDGAEEILIELKKFTPASTVKKVIARGSEYYPTTVGSRWKYRVGEETSVSEIVRHEIFDGAACALMQTSVQGRVVSQEHMEVRDDGVYRRSFQGMKVEPPLLVLKLPPVNGDRWKTQFKVGGEEASGEFNVTSQQVKTPAGEFRGFKVKCEQSAQGVSLLYANWYAKDIGLIQQSAPSPEGKLVVELVEYSIAEAPPPDAAGP